MLEYLSCLANGNHDKRNPRIYGTYKDVCPFCGLTLSDLPPDTQGFAVSSFVALTVCATLIIAVYVIGFLDGGFLCLFPAAIWSLSGIGMAMNATGIRALQFTEKPSPYESQSMKDYRKLREQERRELDAATPAPVTRRNDANDDRFWEPVEALGCPEFESTDAEKIAAIFEAGFLSRMLDEEPLVTDADLPARSPEPEGTPPADPASPGRADPGTSPRGPEAVSPTLLPAPQRVARPTRLLSPNEADWPLEVFA